MDIHKFFDEQIITGSKLPKERQRYTYDDLIAFAKVYANEVNKNCNIPFVRQQRELLIAYSKFIGLAEHEHTQQLVNDDIDEFISNL